MKNQSLIINAVLGVAICILFFLYVKDHSNSGFSKPSVSTSPASTPAISGSTIAYVDLDSLEANYSYYKDKKTEFEKNQKNLENTLQAGMESLQREAGEFEKKAQTMTQAEGEATQQRLLQKKTQLEQLRDNGTQNLQLEMSKFNIDVYDKIDTVLLNYNKDHKYAYILSYQKGGAILYRDKGLDITKDVIDMLNKLGAPKK